MDSRYLRKDFPQLATPSSFNSKQAGSGSGLASKPHKARGITEVSNRNTISKDSTKSNELCTLALRNQDTISKDLTQSDGPFKPEMQNRAATSKDKIEHDKARATALDPGDYITAAAMPPVPLPNDSPGRYALHQPSPAQQREVLFTQYMRAARADGRTMDMQLSPAQLRRLRQFSPAQLHQLRELDLEQLIQLWRFGQRNAAAVATPFVVFRLIMEQQMILYHAAQLQQQAANRRAQPPWL